MYGQTRLADYYTGDLSLRELLNRFMALPQDPPNRAPIWDVIDGEQQAVDADRKADEIDNLLNRYR